MCHLEIVGRHNCQNVRIFPWWQSKWAKFSCPAPVLFSIWGKSRLLNFPVWNLIVIALQRISEEYTVGLPINEIISFQGFSILWGLNIFINIMIPLYLNIFLISRSYCECSLSLKCIFSYHYFFQGIFDICIQFGHIKLAAYIGSLLGSWGTNLF